MKEVVLVNMGAAENRDELEEFLKNMFNDKRILPINKFFRKIAANFIVKRRIEEADKNYKQIGYSPLKKITKNITKNLNKNKTYKFLYCFRYTKPYICDLKLKNPFFIHLYPHYSTTTIESNIDEIKRCFKSYKSSKPLYKYEAFNNTLIKHILEYKSKNYHLIFSLHALPTFIIKKFNDPYLNEIKTHIALLKDELKNSFASISFAFQSRIGKIEWTKPFLEEKLKEFINQKVLIYPLSFPITNSEVEFELKIEYKREAKRLGISEFNVIEPLNYKMEEVIEKIVKEEKW